MNQPANKKPTPSQRIEALEKEMAELRLYIAGIAAGTVFIAASFCNAAPSMREPMLQRLKAFLEWNPPNIPGIQKTMIRNLIRDIETMSAPPPTRQ
jgi:hypothetical protein